MRIYQLNCILLLTLFISVGIKAQDIIRSLEKRVPGQGTIVVHQDSHITALIGTSYPTNGEKKFLKSSGYRVQVYAGNNTRRAKEEALEIASRVKETFPELQVYSYFAPPRWLCRIGDYKSIEEADSIMRKLKSTGMFREVSIVKEVINIPL